MLGQDSVFPASSERSGPYRTDGKYQRKKKYNNQMDAIDKKEATNSFSGNANYMGFSLRSKQIRQSNFQFNKNVK